MVFRGEEKREGGMKERGGKRDQLFVALAAISAAPNAQYSACMTCSLSNIIM